MAISRPAVLCVNQPSYVGHMATQILHFQHLCMLSVISFSKSARSELLIAFPFQVPGIENIVRVDSSFDIHEHCVCRQTVPFLKERHPGSGLSDLAGGTSPHNVYVAFQFHGLFCNLRSFRLRHTHGCHPHTV